MRHNLVATVGRLIHAKRQTVVYYYIGLDGQNAKFMTSCNNGSIYSNCENGRDAYLGRLPELRVFLDARKARLYGRNCLYIPSIIEFNVALGRIAFAVFASSG